MKYISDNFEKRNSASLVFIQGVCVDTFRHSTLPPYPGTNEKCQSRIIIASLTRKPSKAESCIQALVQMDQYPENRNWSIGPLSHICSNMSHYSWTLLLLVMLLEKEETRLDLETMKCQLIRYLDCGTLQVSLLGVCMLYGRTPLLRFSRDCARKR